MKHELKHKKKQKEREQVVESQKQRQAAPVEGSCPHCGGWSRMRPDPETAQMVMVVMSVRGMPAEQRVPPMPCACVCCLSGPAPPGGRCPRCAIQDQLTRSEKCGKLENVFVEAEESWGVLTSRQIKVLSGLLK